MQWFRRSLIAGFFVTVPLVVSVTAFVWIFRAVDGFMGPLFARWWGQELPGLGLLITVLGLLVIGTLATNVFGKRVLEQAETYLLKIPVFRTIYAPVKQLTTALSPDNKYGFKRVVLIEDPERGYVLGFLTKEFILDRGRGRESLLAVYVPTNHLYLGDVRIYDANLAEYPDIDVQQGVRIFLTGGTALDDELRASR
ncbi:uncharacterized protein METZ01_LOCUS2927 [marine metagenome]|jgi:uncharacterized membrane protein|uniref:DUF502 domain-containing protein n=1 Tax=marine metagenome TaxID=408172 RepID=A0A381N928_9ZZZZ|tara:strand:+ start:4024 stop:4614 length:591 start_codon:yes stop_codon:yes gene_type:complete